MNVHKLTNPIDNSDSAPSSNSGYNHMPRYEILPQNYPMNVVMVPYNGINMVSIPFHSPMYLCNPRYDPYRKRRIAVDRVCNVCDNRETTCWYRDKAKEGGGYLCRSCYDRRNREKKEALSRTKKACENFRDCS